MQRFCYAEAEVGRFVIQPQYVFCCYVKLAVVKWQSKTSLSTTETVYSPTKFWSARRFPSLTRYEICVILDPPERLSKAADFEHSDP